MVSLLLISSFLSSRPLVTVRRDPTIISITFIFILLFYIPREFFRTLLSIRTDVNNSVVWIISIRSPIFNFSSRISKHLGIFPSAPITVGITVALMFHSFLNSLGRSKYFLFSLSLIFTLIRCDSPQYEKFSYFFLIISRFGLLAGII